MKMINERTRRAYEQWSFAQMLVVNAGRALAENFDSAPAREELVGVLKAEQRARHAFEKAMRSEDTEQGS